mmetsp:Transcript_53152/g.172869  ORF Transcript_53152/g.172869 Transcript_53152/m.172869 type:complete len:300 (+) Transcript_53152:852-1751(+)
MSMAGFVIASFISLSPMDSIVMFLPSLPTSGESFTEARTEMLGGSMGMQGTGGTSLWETKVCVHFGMKPVTLTATMSPARACFMGSRVTPCTMVISFTLPVAKISPSRPLAMIFSPFWICPLNTFPVTVGPRPGNRSICETNIEKPLHLSSAAMVAGSTSAGFGHGTESRIVSKSASIVVGRSGALASWSVRAQKPCFPDAYSVGYSSCSSLVAMVAKTSKISFSTSPSSRTCGRSTLLMTTIGFIFGCDMAFCSTNFVWAFGPSTMSTSKTTPSTIDKTRSTSPPKSAWPGVSTMLKR